MIVVEDDGVLDAPIVNGHLDVRFELLELELWGVHSDDYQAGVGVLLMPLLDEG